MTRSCGRSFTVDNAHRNVRDAGVMLHALYEALRRAGAAVEVIREVLAVG
jgi:hypothetical protein